MNNTVKKKALVIAISDYENLPKLNFCKNNGEKMSTTLQKAGFKVSKKIIGRTSFDVMRRTINRFFINDDIHSKDTMLFYYTGHGDMSQNGEMYFCTSNYDKKAPDDDGIKSTLITEMMDRCSSNNKIAIIDCCHSGAVRIRGESMGPDDDSDAKAASIRKNLNDKFAHSRSQIVLASSVGVDKSFKHPNRPYSSFSYYLIEGLNGKAVNEDGLITADTLHQYIHDELSKADLLKEQIPVKNGSVEGDSLVLVQGDSLTKRSTTEELIWLLKNGKIKQYLTLKNQNQEIILDFDGFKFPKNIDLEGIDLSRASLVGADFTNVKSLKGASFENADLKKAILSKVNLKSVNFEHSRLTRAKLVKVNLSHANLKGCDLSHADCSEAIFTNSVGFRSAICDHTILNKAVFSGMSLENVTFGGKIKKAKFDKTTLFGVTFDGAVLDDSDFTKAKGRGVRFNDCSLSNVIFKNIRIDEMDLRGKKTNRGMDFSGAHMELSTFESVVLRDTNFSNSQIYKIIFRNVILIRPNFTNAIIWVGPVRETKVDCPITTELRGNASKQLKLIDSGQSYVKSAD